MLEKFKGPLLALLAGAVYPLGFAPFGWWPVTLISVAIIFSLWSKADLKKALLLALLYGSGVYGVGVSWVYVSMVNFGNMLPVMAVIAVILFTLILSTFYLLLVLFYKSLSAYFSPRHQLTIVLPIAWVLAEYLRGTLFTGFSWLYLGYVSIDTWLSSWSSIAGVLLASFLLAYLAGLIADVWQSFTRAQPKARVSGKSLRNQAIIPVILLLLISFGLQQIPWSLPSGEPKNVTLVQANVGLAEKWLPENREKLMQTYLQASKTVEDTDLIVWPEGAMPMLLDAIPKDFIDSVRALGTDVIFGAVKRNTEADGGIYNTMVLLKEDQEGWPELYRKRHLVPFGEFFPLQSILGWIFETMQVPISNFRSGPDGQPYLTSGDLKLLPTICYEDAFPEDWRAQASGAHAIINISEDAWFGDSLAPHQRLQMARMRAIETARPFIRVSNTGLSTVIDAKGDYDAITPQFQPALFTAPVVPMQGDTAYVKYGQWPMWGWILLCLGYGLIRYRSTKTRP